MLKIIKKNRKLQKENEELRMENAELRKAIEEALRDLNDTDLTNKSIRIMSASILLEKALKGTLKSGHSTGSNKQNNLQPYCKAE